MSDDEPWACSDMAHVRIEHTGRRSRL